MNTYAFYAPRAPRRAVLQPARLMRTRLKGEGNGPVAWIPRCGAPELSGRVVPLAHGLIQGQFPVPERPGAQAVGCFLGDGGGRDGEYRAPGVGQAVAAHPAAADPGQWATPSCSHDEQVVGGAGGLDQDRTWFASSDDRPDGQARGFSSHAASSASRSRCEASSAQMRRRVEEGARRSARSPPGGVQARTGISTASAVWRARSFAKRSARRLPGEPVAPTMTRRTGNTESAPSLPHADCRPCLCNSVRRGRADSLARLMRVLAHFNRDAYVPGPW